MRKWGGQGRGCECFGQREIVCGLRDLGLSCDRHLGRLGRSQWGWKERLGQAGGEGVGKGGVSRKLGSTGGMVRKEVSAGVHLGSSLALPETGPQESGSG